METKLFEIRDRMTFIPAMAILLSANTVKENFLLRSGGYGGSDPYILLSYLSEVSQISCDPYTWTHGRTMQVAHKYIIENWSGLKSGDVIDVEYILGETKELKQSGIFEFSAILNKETMEG